MCMYIFLYLNERPKQSTDSLKICNVHISSHDVYTLSPSGALVAHLMYMYMYVHVVTCTCTCATEKVMQCCGIWRHRHRILRKFWFVPVYMYVMYVSRLAPP